MSIQVEKVVVVLMVEVGGDDFFHNPILTKLKDICRNQDLAEYQVLLLTITMQDDRKS